MRRSCEGLGDLHNTYSPRDRRPLAIARLHLDLLEFDLLVPRPRPTVELPHGSKHTPTIKRERTSAGLPRTAKHPIASSQDETFAIAENLIEPFLGRLDRYIHHTGNTRDAEIPLQGSLLHHPDAEPGQPGIECAAPGPKLDQ